MVAMNGHKNTFLFTSESVGEGHPDKIAYGSKKLFYTNRLTHR